MRIFKRSEKNVGCAWSEINKENYDDRKIVESEVRKRGLEANQQNMRKVHKIRKELKKSGKYPLSRDQAERIADHYFIKNRNIWIRAISLLTKTGFIKTQFYYKKQLPAMLDAAAAKQKQSTGIDVDTIIADALR